MQIREPALWFKRRLIPRKLTTRIVIHHTASGDVPVETVHEWHSARPGFNGVGYHYLVRTNGDIERGRPEAMRGVHARQANADSIAIALAGNFEKRPPTVAQMSALVILIRNIRSRHLHWQDLPVVGHSDVTATLCPGQRFPWGELQRRLDGR